MLGIRSPWLLRGLGAVAAAGAGTALRRAYLLATMAAHYHARGMCAGLFVCGRDQDSLLAEDLDAAQHPLLRLIETRVDHAAREVTAGLMGQFVRTVRHEQGWGCVPVRRGHRAPPLPAAAAEPVPCADAWGEAPAARDDSRAARLQPALDWAFAEPDPTRPRRTRAVVVVHRGRLVAERYAPGFSARTPLLGWSLTKSVMNALVGVLARAGRLDPDDPAPVPAWRRPGDPRGKITVGQLLRMSSGLRFAEDYESPLADVGYMLFAAPDMAAYAATRPLEAAPGTLWSYSSGTSNILSAAIREVVGADYATFPRRALFGPLGMASAVIDRDLAGTFVASSYMYATARDWARFGLLYANDGVWEGRRLLPEGWVAFSRRPAPAAPAAEYGAHFWLEVPDTFREARVPPLPADAFHAVGHEGQFVTVVPSRELVVVRLGLTRAPALWDHPAFLHRVIGALTDERAPGAAPQPA